MKIMTNTLIAALLVMIFPLTACADRAPNDPDDLKSSAMLKHLEFFAEKGIRRYDQQKADISYGKKISFDLIAWEAVDIPMDSVKHYAAFSYEADSPSHGTLYGVKYVQVEQVYKIDSEGEVSLSAPGEIASAGSSYWVSEEELRQEHYQQKLKRIISEVTQKVRDAAGEKIALR